MRPLLIALLAALIAWVIGVQALDHYLVAQAGHDLPRVQRGESRIGFEFEQPRDLISGVAEGVQAQRFDAGVLRGQLDAGGANLRLNLRGLELDADRFRRLNARIEVSAPATLVLIFDEPGRLQQLTRAFVLASGWNELDVALDAEPWRPNDGGDATQPWGGDSGRVGEFRLYLSSKQSVNFGLDHVRFVAAAQGPEVRVISIEWITAKDARARLATGQSLRTAAQARLGVLLDVGRELPERTLTLRDRVRAIDAEAVFWPARRPLPELTAQIGPPPSGWSPGWSAIAAYTLLAVLLRGLATRMPPAWAAGSELVVGYAPLLALSLGLGLGEQPATPVLAWLVAALAFQLSGVRTRDSVLVGTASAWVSGLKFTLMGAIGLAAVALLSTHWQLPGAQRMAMYVPFVVVQQLLLLGFLWPRLHALAPTEARTLTAALFAIAHAPNFALMLLSMLAAWWWLGLYQRHRAWLPILVSHYLLGLLAISCLPSEILYSAEVGLRYFLVQ